MNIGDIFITTRPTHVFAAMNDVLNIANDLSNKTVIKSLMTLKY